MTLIGSKCIEPITDLPPKFSTTALDAAIEFNELSRQVGRSFAKIQKLVEMIDKIIFATKNDTMSMYSYQPCALYILDRAFADWSISCS